MSALDENKALVRRHIEEAISLDRPEVWSDIMAEDFIIHHPLVEPGRAGYAAGLGLLRAGFPDLNVEVLDVVAENDRVVVRYIERGTHTGDFGPSTHGTELREAWVRAVPGRRRSARRVLAAGGRPGVPTTTLQLTKRSSSRRSGSSPNLRCPAGIGSHVRRPEVTAPAGRNVLTEAP